jgi:amyloid beta A4 protein
MEDYLTALRSKDETPGSLLSMSRDAEAAILDKFRAEVQARQEGKGYIFFILHTYIII